MDPLLREFDHVPPGWWYPVPLPPAPPPPPMPPLAGPCCRACRGVGVEVPAVRSCLSSDLSIAVFVMVTIVFLACLCTGPSQDDDGRRGDEDDHGRHEDVGWPGHSSR